MKGYFFANLPADLPTELIETLVESENVRIERIVSRGHASPNGFWYDQPQAEWVLVLAGEALLRFEDCSGPIRLKPGDFLNIPAHVRHRVEWTMSDQPTVWLAIHYAAAH